ncbi:IS66 family transposase zinc-finger binding domain-containing protein [Mesorhizobium sp. f-mel]
MPAQLRVIVVRRPKYACRACEDVVVQAPAPARLIEGGLPTEATVSQVLVPNMPITCRSIVRRRSMLGRVSIWIAPRSLTGSAARPGI